MISYKRTGWRTDVIVGLSTETKPTDVENGYRFCEIDTGYMFAFDAEHSQWHKLPGSSVDEDEVRAIIDDATAELQAELDEAISGATEDSEVINARVDADGTTYSTLKQRLDAENTELKNQLDAMRIIVANDFAWAIGGIRPETGANYSNTKIIRSALTDLNYDSIRILPGYQAVIYVYDKNTMGYLGVYNGTDTFITAAYRWDVGDVNVRLLMQTYLVRFALVRTDGANIAEAESSNLLLIRDTDDTLQLRDRAADAYEVGKRVTALEDITFLDLQLATKQNQWVRKTIGSGTGAPKYESSTTRISTSPAINTLNYNQLRVVPSAGYQHRLVGYNDTLTTRLYTSDWETSEQTYDISGYGNCIFLIAKDDDSTITTDDYDKVNFYAVNAITVFDNLENRLKALPDYWQTYMDAKQPALDAADISLGFYGTSFIFVTDVHVNGNNMMSPKLIKYLLEHTALNMVVCGGDIVSGYNTYDNAVAEITKWRDAMDGTGSITIYGNHDGNSNAQPDSTAIIPKSAFYGLIDRETENVVNWEPGYLYGYADNSAQKIRYLYLDTGAPDSATMSAAEVNWMKSKLLELSNGWYAVIFAHQFWTNTSASSTPTLDGNGTKIINALTDIYENMTGKVACVVAGHAHRDISMVTDMGFPVIATTCDTSYNASTWDPDNPTRTAGTTTEQAFDIYYVNTDAKTIDTIRIGAGDTTSDRHFTFT